MFIAVFVFFSSIKWKITFESLLVNLEHNCVQWFDQPAQAYNFKIASKAVANRIEKARPLMAKPTRKGFVKGCCIAKYIRLANDSLD